MQKSTTITKETIADQLKNQLRLVFSKICEEITLHIFSKILQLTKNKRKTISQNLVHEKLFIKI